MIYENVTELVGDTPMIHLHRLNEYHQVQAHVIAKIEAMNPAGSAKDRIAKNMILTAQAQGRLKPGATIIEPTSENTGIGLASIGASLGYRTIFTMPETMSIERQKLLKAYGATVILTEGKKGMQGAIDKAKELADTIENSFLASQFENPENPHAHYMTTGPEIWEDTKGKIDIFVAGVGTGGTISGVGKYLKEQNPNIQVIAVEPFSSPVLSQGKASSHGIQGIGAGFIPNTLDTSIYDEIITVKEEDAYAMGRQIAQKEGLLVGISSGAALHAAYILAKRKENQGKNIVVLLPDTGERYLSTPMFDGKEE